MHSPLTHSQVWKVGLDRAAHPQQKSPLAQVDCESHDLVTSTQLNVVSTSELGDGSFILFNCFMQQHNNNHHPTMTSISSPEWQCLKRMGMKSVPNGSMMMVIDRLSCHHRDFTHGRTRSYHHMDLTHGRTVDLNLIMSVYLNVIMERTFNLSPHELNHGRSICRVGKKPHPRTTLHHISRQIVCSVDQCFEPFECR